MPSPFPSVLSAQRLGALHMLSQAEEHLDGQHKMVSCIPQFLQYLFDRGEISFTIPEVCILLIKFLAITAIIIFS